MALIVEDGSGVVGAEAFGTTTESDVYWAARGNTDWTSQTETEKEENLRKGADYLEDKYRTRLQGYRTHEEQGLSFPRYSVYDADGFLIDSDVVPTKVKQANFEAGNEARKGELEPAEDSAGRIQSESKKLGPMSKSVTYSGGKVTEKTFPRIRRLMLEFVVPGGKLRRG